jgi:hypothetical protein
MVGGKSKRQQPQQQHGSGGVHSSSCFVSVAWILIQLLAPMASMVAIVQLLHYLRTSSHIHGESVDPRIRSSNSNSSNDTSIIHINDYDNGSGRIRIDMALENLDPALQGLRLADCMYFWAPSAISTSAGWGVFTAIDMKRGAITQSMPDLCFDYDHDHAVAKTANAIRLESFIWSRDVLFPASSSTTPSSTPLSSSGQQRHVICQGMASLVNSMPNDERRTATSKVIPAMAVAVTTTPGKSSKTTRRLARSIVTEENQDADAKSSNGNNVIGGAWLFSANHKIPAGSELTIEYYRPEKFYDPATFNTTVEDAPRHQPEWLRQHGKCLDHVEIKTSLIATTPTSNNNNSKSMGRQRQQQRRGAFATRNLIQGSTVLPAPVLALANPKLFHNNDNNNSNNPLPLWVNYCFQLAGTDTSSVLFFPYTPGIGAIHHKSQNPNVAIRWSQDSENENDDDDQVATRLKNATPGTVIYNLEVYALSSIRKGDELFMDFGSEWETANEEYQKSLATKPSTKRSRDAKTSRPVFRHSIMLPGSLLPSSVTR